jgi:hypothetical protein
MMAGPVYRGGWRRWLGLCGGLALVLAFAFLLAHGNALPGPMGDLVRHNQRLGIDVNALFYTELDRSANYSYQDLFLRRP